MTMRRTAMLALALAVSLAAGSTAQAQSVSIQSIAAEPALGDVSSAPSGDTVFRAAAIDGMVRRQSGNGYRIGTGNTRALVTLACGTDTNCRNRELNITINSIGSPTGRANALSNFTVSAGTAQMKSGVTGTNPVSFRIAPIGENGTATFYVGADFAIYGNESPLTTGPATSRFQVVATMTPSGGTASGIGTASANVRRALGVQALSSLSFGTIARPNTGMGSATIDATTGALSLTGNRIRQMPGTVGRAQFEVSGEGGQSFSLSIPPTFTLSGPGGPLTVQTSTTISGLQTLDGSIGSTASKVFSVGGSVQIPYNLASGSYSGSFVVSVQYQ